MIERESFRVYQLSVFVLSFEWIVFGSMHFTMRLATEAQVPGFIQWKTFVAVTTGMIEVTTGILLLITRTRKWAAITSLVLLALFLPSIYKMMIDDAAIAVAPQWRNLARVLLVPNHVFMALCAVYLVQWPRRPERPAPAPPAVRRGFGWTRPTYTGAGASLTVGLTMLAANLAGFAVVLGSPLRHSTALLWALMCLAVGGLVGFLFGIPRVAYGGDQAAITHRPNSNIEQVSDWLTKILVGVGLVQFHKLGEFLTAASLHLGGGLAAWDLPRARAFATALIVYFFVAGVIQGYLLTRMYLTERFEEYELAPPGVVPGGGV